MAGRRPKPLSLIDNKKYKKSKEELESRQANNPEIKSNNLACPPHLSLEARKEWKKIIKLYKELNIPIFNDLDKNALEIYCNAIVDYRKIREQLDKFDSNELSVTKYLYTMKTKTLSEIKTFGQMLLLDPISRAKMSVASKDKTKDEMDEMDKLLSINPRDL